MTRRVMLFLLILLITLASLPVLAVSVSKSELKAASSWSKAAFR